MEDSGKKVWGFFGVIAVVFGILAVTGVVRFSSNSVTRVVKGIGTGLLIFGGVIIAIVIAVVIISLIAMKKDGDDGLKMEAKQFIREKKSQVNKLKSQVTVLKMKKSQLQTKINDIDRRIEGCTLEAENLVAKGDDAAARLQLEKKQELLSGRELYVKNMQEYDTLLDQLEASVEKLECEIVNDNSRMDSAISRMKLADSMKQDNGSDSTDGEDSISKLEENALYEKDYQDAMRELNGK